MKNIIQYKGSFNVRISPSLHKSLAIVSLKNGESLNASVEKAIEQYVYNTESSYLMIMEDSKEE